MWARRVCGLVCGLTAPLIFFDAGERGEMELLPHSPPRLVPQPHFCHLLWAACQPPLPPLHAAPSSMPLDLPQRWLLRLPE